MQIRASYQAETDFAQAFLNHKDEIFRHCYFIMFSREVALELMQEAFTKTWEYISNGHDIDNVRAFLYRVASNLCFNAKRKKHEVSLEMLQEEGFDPPSEDTILSRDFIAEDNVKNALEQLDEPYRTAVSMRFVHGFRPVEIAAIVGETANTVSVRTTRGMQQLRKNMKHA